MCKVGHWEPSEAGFEIEYNIEIICRGWRYLLKTRLWKMSLVVDETGTSRVVFELETVQSHDGQSKRQNTSKQRSKSKTKTEGRNQGQPGRSRAASDHFSANPGTATKIRVRQRRRG